MSEEMYCGIKAVPKGKIRGTPEYCAKNKQVRFYGIKHIDKNLLEEVSKKAPNVIKEQLKLKKAEDNGKILIKKYKNLMVVIDDKNIKSSQRKKAKAAIAKLLIKRDIILNNINKQKKIVQAAEKQHKLDQKEAKKEAIKAKKKSGSKTKKK
jgi:hypothetical protein